MNKFWQFAREVLHYKPLMAMAIGAAVMDAMCAFGGFGTLLYVVDMMLGEKRTLYELLEQQLVNPEVQAYVGDLSGLLAYIPQNAMGGFVLAMVVILVLTFFGSTFRFIHQYVTITVSFRAVMRVRRAVFQRLVHLPMPTLSSVDMSDQLSRVLQDCNALASGFNALFARAVRDLLLGAAFMAWALIINPTLTLLFLATMPVIAVVLRKFGKHIRRASRRALQQYGQMLGSVTESMLAIRVVKVNQAEGYERRRFNKVNRRVFAQEMKARTVRALSSPVIETVAITGVVVVATVAAWLVFEKGHTPNELIKVIASLGMAGASLRPLANLNNDLQAASGAAVRLDELIHHEVEPDTIHHRSNLRHHLPRHRRSVLFDNIVFAYPGTEQPALQQINLEVPYGTSCAIVGGNGSGKTTLLSLLPRLYEPQQGRILIDGHDIADYSLRSVRGQIAVVTQETVLFEGTIADNIRYGHRHATDAQVVAAAKRAFADEFIRAIPNGYASQVGVWGSRLSGGQRQRIALARAFLRQPSILILDEATSQIDSESEAKINTALNEFMADRTSFIIAHRLSTVIGADRIVVLEAGRIEAVGNHQQLLESSDIYRVLCRTQFLPESAES